MRKNVKKSAMSKGTIRFDGQYRYQVDVGYRTARQKALELAMAVDEDCVEVGIDRSPKCVASWGDDRRPPFFWVNPDIDDSRVVLMYECRHFLEDDCEQPPSTLHAANELLVHAHDFYPRILSIKFYSFENVGHPSGPKTFIDEQTVSIVRPLQRPGVVGLDTGQWMEGLSAAELLMQFGIDPDVRVTPYGKRLTLEGETFTVSTSDSSSSSSCSESGSCSESDNPGSSGDECKL